VLKKWNPDEHPGLDSERIFAATPALFLVLDVDAMFTIVGASDAYLRATSPRATRSSDVPCSRPFPITPRSWARPGR
jgi:hypothetical protein